MIDYILNVLALLAATGILLLTVRARRAELRRLDQPPEEPKDLRIPPRHAPPTRGHRLVRAPRRWP